MPSGGPRPARREAGRRAGLTLQRIIEAARSLDVATLTVQAVADKLGVGRKAVRHHVTDLRALLDLVAPDALSEGAPSIAIPATAPGRMPATTTRGRSPTPRSQPTGSPVTSPPPSRSR